MTRQEIQGARLIPDPNESRSLLRKACRFFLTDSDTVVGPHTDLVRNLRNYSRHGRFHEGFVPIEFLAELQGRSLSETRGFLETLRKDGIVEISPAKA